MISYKFLIKYDECARSVNAGSLDLKSFSTFKSASYNSCSFLFAYAHSSIIQNKRSAELMPDDMIL